MTTADESARNLAVIRRYFAVIADGPTGAELDEFFDPAVVQEEFPNRLLPDGVTRDMAGLREAASRGLALLREQRFELLDAFASGSRVAAESAWTGTVGQDIGPFKAGTVLRARFAQIFELKNGRIVKLRNYDCIYPWQESSSPGA